jgi:pyruvate-ferredoxin/flavodoxin oxidoreductase
VLDTEVYSNTGGQASKATPLGAVAKFAYGGKRVGKKDLFLQASSYGNVYVARVAFGDNPQQTLRVPRGGGVPGPSLILAYSPCIAHGIDLRLGLDQQRRAVHSGYWPLMRYNPRSGIHHAGGRRRRSTRRWRLYEELATEIHVIPLQSSLHSRSGPPAMGNSKWT